MTNIFARKPLKTSQAVAKRYEPWITVFERLVSDAQKKIQEISKHERLYTVVRDFMELQGLVNNTKIDVDKYGLTITVEALPTNLKADIERLHERLHEKLHNEGLRKAEKAPSLTWGGYYTHDVTSNFQLGNGIRIVHHWIIPSTGIFDLMVETIRKETVSYDTLYKLVPRTQELTNDKSTAV